MTIVGTYFPATAQNYCATVNDINKVVLHAYSAAGIAGWYESYNDYLSRDCFTGQTLSYPHCEYPKGSGITYIYNASFWAGGITAGDTVISRGIGSVIQGSHDPSFYQYEPPTYRSILEPSSPGYNDAVSEQDVISVSDDTTGLSSLGLEIVKTTYAWTYQYAEDIVFYDVEFHNIGTTPIREAFFGPYLDVAAGFFDGSGSSNVGGGIGGFKDSIQSLRCISRVDEVPVVWFSSSDGWPVNGRFTDDVVLGPDGEWIRSCPSTGAFVLLGYPTGRIERRAYVSFNWWRRYGGCEGTPDLAPARRDHQRLLGPRCGYLQSQGDTYYEMSNGEIDYDPLYSARIGQNDAIWRYPNQEAAQYVSSNGDLLSYLLTVGPYDIDPGQSMHIAYALVFGERFHTNANNRDFLPDNPDRFYANLDFSDLEKNISWAKWIYDNPGVDTDSDGYAGDLVICNQDSVLTDSGWVTTVADTFYATGDGVPDWRPVSPPPSPDLWLEPLVDGIRIRFNGYRSETTKDVFSGIVDFEGYSVYLGRDEREQSLSLIASYDKEDYDRYVYNPASERYEVHGIPLPLDSLRCLYGRSDDPCADSAFDPLAYELPTRPYVHPRFPDSLFNFRKNSYNANHYPTQTPIHKVYPDAPDPRGIDPEDLTPDYFTEEGRLKFFEYECEVHNLLSSVQYWVAVTAFDFGMPGTTIRPLESARSINATSCFVYANEGEQNGTNKQVYVYPNPYVASQDYRSQGYEGRTREDRPDYRTRAVNFANLPPKCTISIYSLDGDLVRRIEHDYSPNDPNSTHDYWDVITRNTEAPVSGLYYWTVEIPGAPTQIGKLVLIY